MSIGKNNFSIKEVGELEEASLFSVESFKGKFPYKKIGDANQIKLVINFYTTILHPNNIVFNSGVDFLTNLLRKKNISEGEIKGTQLKGGKFVVFLTGGEKIKFTLQNIQNYLVGGILGGENIEMGENGEEKTQKQVVKETKEKARNIERAIELIYQENKGFFQNDEIDDEDFIDEKLIKDNNFLKDFENCNIKDLKKLLEAENKKLLDIYEIRGNTSGQQEILKKELKFFAGLGDTYEGAAKYLKMSTKEMEPKIKMLVSSMNSVEIFDYIRNVNQDIYDNNRRSDGVDQVNGLFMDTLYKTTLKKLQKSNNKDTDKDLVAFAALVSGRGELEMEGDESYPNKTDFEYGNIDMLDQHKAPDIARKALMYAMFRPHGVLQTAAENKSKAMVELEDKELHGQTPQEVIAQVKKTIDAKNPSVKNYSAQYFKKAHMESYLSLSEPYNTLTLDQKIGIGALARLIDTVEGMSQQELENPEFMKNVGAKMINNAFQDLNNNLSNNFRDNKNRWGVSDWSITDNIFSVDGKHARDLGLTGEMAEIFNLYQDMNGSTGIFDFKDENVWDPGNGTMIMGVGLIAGAIVMSPLMAASGTAYTAAMAIEGATFLSGYAAASSAVSSGAWAIAGAQIGFTTGVASTIFSHQGYDSSEEMYFDVSTQIAADTIISALFMRFGMPALQKYFKTVNPDLLFSKDAWKWATGGIADKILILIEIIISGFAVPALLQEKKQERYAENYYDVERKDKQS